MQWEAGEQGWGLFRGLEQVEHGMAIMPPPLSQVRLSVVVGVQRGVAEAGVIRASQV